MCCPTDPRWQWPQLTVRVRASPQESRTLTELKRVTGRLRSQRSGSRRTAAGASVIIPSAGASGVNLGSSSLVPNPSGLAGKYQNTREV